MSAHYTIDTSRSDKLDKDIAKFLKSGGKIRPYVKLVNKPKATKNKRVSMEDLEVVRKFLELSPSHKKMLASKLNAPTSRISQVMVGKVGISSEKLHQWISAMESIKRANA